MAKDILAKFDRPPFVHNWVRNNQLTFKGTVNELLRFAEFVPRYTYVAANPIFHDILTLNLDRETALQAARTRGAPNSRRIVTDAVEAFLSYRDASKLGGTKSFDYFITPFQVGRDYKVPVKPLTVISVGGVLEPVFVFPWKKWTLGTFQTRLMMTVIEDAVFSLSDFPKSRGYFVSLAADDGGLREAEVWHRGDYELLSDAALRNHSDMFLEALAEAKRIVATWPDRTTRGGDTPSAPEIDPRQTDLFD